MCPRCGALSLCGHPFLHESNPAKPWFRRYALLQGGTQAAPPYFNDRNREDPDNYWPSASGCDYVVTLRDEHGALLDTLGEAAGLCTSWPSPPAGLHTGLLSQVQSSPDLLCSPASPGVAAAGDEGLPAWEQVASLPFVDQARSPPLFRAFYVPRLSATHNRRYEYVLLRRKGGSGAQHAAG